MVEAPKPPFYRIAAVSALPPGGAVEVGNKAWNLMRMVAAGLPVPAGFVLPTTWCRSRGRGMENAGPLTTAVADGIAGLERATGLGFGSPRRPLLVSVRSGAAASMPGMLETVLDVGLNAESVEGLIRLTGNPRLAWDCYRRLVVGFAEVVEELPLAPFDARVRAVVAQTGASTERDLDHRSLHRLSDELLDEYRALSSKPFPQDPYEQLARAAAAVFRSWDAPKAVAYRRLNGIDDETGTAATVQAMVFGNAGGDSGAGVGFTRNPATGEPELYLDFQFNAQGEDVVAGRQVLTDQERLQRRLPSIWRELEKVAHRLETLFGDAQDFEFTLQSGRLFLLQTRDAKRTPWAALRIATDLVAEGLITPADALERLRGIDVANVTRSRLAGDVPAALAGAKVASLGVASGAIALDAAAAERLGRDGNPVILVRGDIATADIEGIAQSVGILTRSGGRTSHAAVVARQLGKVCLVGCQALSVDLPRRICRIGGQTFAEGDFLALDGNNGVVYPGRLEIVAERPERELAAIMEWRRHA